MAVSTVGSWSGSFGATTGAIIATMPAGIQANDLIVVAIGANSYAGTWTPATGYTLQHDGGGGSGVALSMPLFTKVAVGGEGSASFTHSLASPDGAVGTLVLRGIDTTTPVLGFSADNNVQAASGVAGAVSWTGAADAVSLLCYTWQGDGSTVTLPSGWNASPDGWGPANDGFEFTGVGCNLTIQSAVTSLPSATVTWPSAPYGALTQFALKAAAAAPSAPVDPFTPQRMPLGA